MSVLRDVQQDQEAYVYPHGLLEQLKDPAVLPKYSEFVFEDENTYVAKEVKKSNKGTSVRSAKIQEKKVKDIQTVYRIKVDQALDRAFPDISQMYNNAFHGGHYPSEDPVLNQKASKLFILGDETLRTEAPSLYNFGTIASQTSAAPGAIRVKLEAESRDCHGGILCDSSWSVLKNDATILGAIHARRVFMISASTVMPEDELLYDNANGRTRVMGREITMLHAAGYKRLRHDNEENIGIVMVPTDLVRAQAMTFKHALNAIGRVHSASDVRKFLEGVNEISYDEFEIIQNENKEN